MRVSKDKSFEYNELSNIQYSFKTKILKNKSSEIMIFISDLKTKALNHTILKIYSNQFLTKD